MSHLVVQQIEEEIDGHEQRRLRKAIVAVATVVISVKGMRIGEREMKGEWERIKDDSNIAFKYRTTSHITPPRIALHTTPLTLHHQRTWSSPPRCSTSHHPTNSAANAQCQRAARSQATTAHKALARKGIEKRPPSHLDILDPAVNREGRKEKSGNKVGSRE
jgi:hypothetical protein